MKKKKVVILFKSGKEVVVKCLDYRITIENQKIKGESFLGANKIFAAFNVDEIAAIYEKV